jgi:predicted CXXCH cytochrome family protein
MPYPYAGTRSTYSGVTARAKEADGFLPDPTTGNIRLYSEDGGHIAARPKPGATGIECSSCHDPHNTDARERRLLRARLDGSSKASGYLCSQCHGLYGAL